MLGPKVNRRGLSARQLAKFDPKRLAARFPGKRAFISGAAAGQGRDFAAILAAQGWILGLNDTAASGLADTAAAATALGGIVQSYVFDVADGPAFQAAADDFLFRHGGVDLVINNAGIGSGGYFEDFSLENWREVVDVNLLGVVHGCKAFLPALLRQRSGVLLNIASAASFHGLPMISAYNATKAAVMALSETLFTELEGSGAGVAIQICTMFKSDFAVNFRGNLVDQAVVQKMVDGAPITSHDAAVYTLDRLSHGEFYIVIPTDAHILWRIKRLSPTLYLKVKRKIAARIGTLRPR